VQSKLEEDLRQRVFPIVEILANGFAERSENKIMDVDLPRLYESCLIFLYRLLFILYAEGRDLLPVEPKSRKYYKELSLARLPNPLKAFSEFDSHSRTRLYQDIQELCHLINGSDEKKNAEYKVPRYNGGLFDPERYPLLEQWRVCDAVLAAVLRSLLLIRSRIHTSQHYLSRRLTSATCAFSNLGRSTKDCSNITSSLRTAGSDSRPTERSAKPPAPTTHPITSSNTSSSKLSRRS